MNEYLERIFELPLRQRVLLLVGAVGLLFLGYAWMFYWPLGETIAAKEKQLDALQRQLQRKKSLAANLDQARAKVEELRAGLRKAVAQLPDTKEIPGLLSTMSGLARHSGLTIVQFRQLPSNIKDFYAEVPVRILVRGTYLDIEAFLERLGNMTRIVNVRELSIKAPARIEEEPVRVEASATAVTFRFLTEQERKQVERRRAEGKKGRRR